jgi:hypothetical protein
LDTLARFERAHRRRELEELRACFHDRALIESVASEGEPLGADETAEAIERAFGDGVYAIRDWTYEEVAPGVVLSATNARHQTPETSIRDEAVVRLIVGRDGLMWRVRLFCSREEALAYLALPRREREAAPRAAR